MSEHDLDPGQIEGTGQGGRITRADVLSFIDTGKSKPAPEEDKDEKKEKAPAPAAREEKPAPRRDEAPAPAAKAGQDDEAIAFSNIRRRTAEHMVRSKATSAHVLTAIEADFENVDRVRRAAQAEWKEREGFTLTYLPFISRAVIDAIEDYPHVNASVGDDELIVHHRVHLGIAVDLSFQGLLAPVIHDADGKRLRAIAREVHDLAARARAKKLSADEIQGGTFTITNPGGYGTLITAPIINQPQVAILSTDGVKKKPVAVELPDGGDAVVVHPVGILALSFDHRAFDGAYASAFIARVKEILETRDWSQEL
jgi:2-oxoglutarate dehydrogenase E2 component (dihydrolipoamide succinyltransferase)